MAKIGFFKDTDRKVEAKEDSKAKTDMVGTIIHHEDLEEILKTELSHYPSHVLARALFTSLRAISKFDPSFIDAFHNLDDDEFNADQCSKFAIELVNLINDIYLGQKDKIDLKLKEELH